jgi:hypothetical protein
LPLLPLQPEWSEELFLSAAGVGSLRPHTTVALLLLLLLLLQSEWSEGLLWNGTAVLCLYRIIA